MSQYILLHKKNNNTISLSQKHIICIKQDWNVYTLEIYTSSALFYFLCQIVDEQYEESRAHCINLPNTYIVVKWFAYIILLYNRNVI